MIYSDFHIHSEHSYDSELPLETVCSEAERLGLRAYGVTDHVNYNEEIYLSSIRGAASHYAKIRDRYPGLILGV